jgi:hypothetical protein
LHWFWQRWAAPFYQRQELVKAAEQLPETDMRRALLNDATVRQILAAYEREDGRAMFYQALHQRQGQLITVFAMLGVLTVAASYSGIAHLYWGGPQMVERLGAVQWGLIASLMLLSTSWPEAMWMSARTAAERHRGSIFGAIVDVQSTITPDASMANLSPAKFLLVDQAHARDQLAFFRKRAGETKAGGRRVLSHLMLAVVRFAYAVAIVAFLTVAAWQVVTKFGLKMPSILADVLSRIGTTIDGDKSLFLVGATCIAAMLRGLRLSGLTARYGTLYAEANMKLGAIVDGAESRALRDRAQAGDPIALRSYVDRIRIVLVEVHDAWADGRRSSQTFDPGDLIKEI